MDSYLQNKSHSCQNPFRRFLLCSQVECPDVGWSSLPGFIDWTGVEESLILFILESEVRLETW